MSFANKLIKSSFFIIAIRLVQRGIGIFSFLILARILTPEDFGIVSIATLLVFLCDILSETGAQQYIVHKEVVDDNDLNTSWTLGIILKSLLAIVLILASPFVASFYELPQLTVVLQIIALVLPLSALNNPKMLILKRNLDYKPFLTLAIYDKVLSFIFTMTLAFVLKSYWAMIFGVVFSYLVKLVMSYLIVSYQPKLTLKKFTEQWAFSKWVLLRALVGYGRSEFDTAFISKLYGVEVLGGFTMMKNLSTTPSREIIRPLVEPLLASFSKVRNNSQHLNEQIIKCITTLLLVIGPICVAMTLFDRELVQVLFNEKWYKFADIVGMLSILILNMALASILREALVSLGKVRFLFYFDTISFIFTIGFIYVLVGDGNIEKFIILNIISNILSTLFLLFYITRYFEFDFWSLFITNFPLLLVSTFFLTVDIKIVFENAYLNLILNGFLYIIFFIFLLVITMLLFLSLIHI